MYHLSLPSLPSNQFPLTVIINEGCFGLILKKPETWFYLIRNSISQIVKKHIEEIQQKLKFIERMSQSAWISSFEISESKRTYLIITAWQSEYQIIVCFRQITVMQHYPQLYNRIEIQHKRTKRFCGINLGSKTWTEVKYIPRGLNQSELECLSSFLNRSIEEHPKYLPETSSRIKLNTKLLEIRLIYEEEIAKETNPFVVLKMEGKKGTLYPIKEIKVPRVNINDLDLEVPRSEISKLVQWEIRDKKITKHATIAVHDNAAYEVHVDENGNKIHKQIKLTFIPTKTNGGAVEI